MNIIIVGCGKIGRVILSSLAKENHNITAIDIKENVIENLRTTYDIMAICGNGTSYNVLKEANVENCDLFISVTSSDEMNMLSCFAAKKMGAKYTVARIRTLENNNDSLDFMKKELDLSLSINPELLTAQAIYNILKLPAATKIESFSSNQMEMLEIIIKPNSHLDGVTLKNLRKTHKGKYLICAVRRGDSVIIPRGDFALKSGDKIGLIAAEDDLNDTLEMLDVPHKKVNNVIIIGAGITSKYLANMLIEHRIPVKLIEKSQEICESVCNDLPPKATIINGNGMSQDLLIEEGISSTDGLVSLTGRDEENILISVYGLSASVPKVICKINQEELDPIAEKLGIDSIISPRKVTANLIVKYARALEDTLDSQIETLYTLMGGMAEALEFKVLTDSRLTRSPLKTLKLKKGVLIAGIIRGQQAIIPNGEDMILPNDKVIVISAGVKILDLLDILL